jgi:Protein of unknown function (DUF1681)
MEQTLFICRSVDVFMPVPPRTARGFVSGEWLIENKIATTRIRVIAIDARLEVRLEDLERYIEVFLAYVQALIISVLLI